VCLINPVAMQVGNELSSVEALWSQFENVMARDEDAGKANEQDDAEADEAQTQQHAASGGSSSHK
jgi:DASH complex subunit DAD1